MTMVFSMAAEVERGLISARTKDALRARRTSGLPVGRPKGPCSASPLMGTATSLSDTEARGNKPVS